MEPFFFKSPLTRYYTKYFFKYKEEPPLVVRMHTNKLFLTFLGEDHPARHATKFTYRIESQEQSGKRKKGAVKISANTVIADAEIEGLGTLPIRAGVSGKLIETNSLCDFSSEEAYIAVIMPALNKVQSVVETLTKD